MTDPTPVNLTRGLARKVDNFFKAKQSQPDRTPPRPDEPGPRRATIGSPIGQGEVGSAQMVGFGTVVRVYNPGPTAQGDVAVYWSAGTEVSADAGDDPPPRGQWEVLTAGTEGTEPGTGFPPGTSLDLNCDCDRLITGQDLDCDVCPCGNLYRWGFFGTLELPAAGEEGPVTWTASGGQKRLKHLGACLWATGKFNHPSGDKYRYEIQLTAGTDGVEATLRLVRTDGENGPLVEANWCLNTKAECDFECIGVWLFKRARPWANVNASSIACSFCVTPATPKRKANTSTATCACEATIKLPLRFTGPSADVEELAEHGFGEDIVWTHWLGWQNMWELEAAINVERFGDGVIPPYSGSPTPCNPHHLQARGTATVPPGGLGNVYTAIWNSEAFIVGDEETVTITVSFYVHLESWPLDNGNEDYEAVWSRTFQIELTCDEYRDAITFGSVTLPEIQQADAEGTYPGSDAEIVVYLDGSYPPQIESTSSYICGPPDETEGCDTPCMAEVYLYDGPAVATPTKAWRIKARTGCESANCGCDGMQYAGCVPIYTLDGDAAASHDVGFEKEIPCVEGTGWTPCGPVESVTATIDMEGVTSSVVITPPASNVGGAECNGEILNIEMWYSCGENGCPTLNYDLDGCTGIAGLQSITSLDPLDVMFVIPAGVCCGADIPIHVTE